MQVVKKGLSDKMNFEQRSERNEELAIVGARGGEVWRMLSFQADKQQILRLARKCVVMCSGTARRPV